MARDVAAKSDIKQELRRRQRAWLQELVKLTGRSASQIAGESGVSDTTLTRLLHNPDYQGTLSQLTVDRIKTKLNVAGPDDLQGRKRGVLPFHEAERLELDGESSVITRLIRHAVHGRPGAEPWILKTDVLESAGYLRGDVVIVDVGVEPKAQDAVCAQVFDVKRGGAETIWRIYMPPYLVGAANDRTAYRPLLIDNESVIVHGVIVESYRPHRLSATR